MVRIRHAATSIAAVSIAGAGIFTVLPSGAAAAAPAYRPSPRVTVYSSCGNGKTGNNQWICVQVSENPWHVEVSDKIRHATRTVELCLRKDGLPDRCMPNQTVAPGETDSALYDYQGPGRYCAVVYRVGRHGKRTGVAEQCVG